MVAINDLEFVPEIKSKIFTIRGKMVMFDRDLSALYGVDTRQLNRQVRRNIDRFPERFAFQLTYQELADWMCQFGTSNSSTKMGMRKRPYVFTEHGVAMLSSVLKSKRAVEVNIQIIDTFIEIRETFVDKDRLNDRIRTLEETLGVHDEKIRAIINTIRDFLVPKVKKVRKIGFKINEND